MKGSEPQGWTDTTKKGPVKKKRAGKPKRKDRKETCFSNRKSLGLGASTSQKRRIMDLSHLHVDKTPIRRDVDCAKKANTVKRKSQTIGHRAKQTGEGTGQRAFVCDDVHRKSRWGGETGAGVAAGRTRGRQGFLATCTKVTAAARRGKKSRGNAKKIGSKKATCSGFMGRDLGREKKKKWERRKTRSD